jgi:AAA family ATP:ADP antiporter
MLAAVPVFGAWSRAAAPAVPLYHVANIAIFWLLLTFDVGKIHVARVFFVWISVFNLFAVSVFWSFMSDAQRTGQAPVRFHRRGRSPAGALLDRCSPSGRSAARR